VLRQGRLSKNAANGGNANHAGLTSPGNSERPPQQRCLVRGRSAAARISHSAWQMRLAARPSPLHRPSHWTPAKNFIDQ
jgi:hypothetical protein